MVDATGQAPRFLVKHVGNMGDMVFLVPPVLAALKKEQPGCHITLVTAWGYKDSQGRWGKRNQGGHSIHLMMTNPNVNQLVHYCDSKLSLAGNICREDGKNFPSWSKADWEKEKKSGRYERVIELDFGLKATDNPLQRAFARAGVDKNNSTVYKLYLTKRDKAIAQSVTNTWPRPRIILTESLSGQTARSWDPTKVQALVEMIKTKYGVYPVWFGQDAPYFQGRRLSLRENIATLTFADVCIGVMSGPLHFAAAVGLPTLVLYGDYPLHRAAPAYFFNQKTGNARQWHRTLLGPQDGSNQQLKPTKPYACLTAAQLKTQGFKHWSQPGRQSTKSCLAAITVDEIMLVLSDMI